ncbi:MAG TPA: RagB/SusD family nutrient uptake outer membrane protein, partial [Prolixibacteraceae bacterium]|nr:RagB/SusD family nutrient uptake outer membrane protein [Prolixibacteraceae bacterium]
SMVESIFEIQFNDNYDSQENPFYKDMIPVIGSAKISLKTTAASTLFNTQDIRRFGTKSPTWKYQGIDPQSTTRRTNTQRDANIIYYRYADILLMKAEALTEMNSLIEANALLRQVVERIGFSHIEIASKNDLRKAIIDEKGREFVFEGKRWFDLLRYAKRNKFENKQIIINMILSGADVKQQAILRTRVYDTMSYYLPIPERDLLYNNQLVQNPFYDR